MREFFLKIFGRKSQINERNDYNQLISDIRMKKISFDEAIDFLCSMEQQWIYIKFLNGNNQQYVNIYTKFRIRKVMKNQDFIQLCGYEDKDNLHIDLKRVRQTEVTYNYDEIRLVLEDEINFTDIYIKKYQPNAETRYNEILNTNQHMIITEGKTDCIILKKALNYFKKLGKYTNLDVTFFEFNSDTQMGEDKVYKICEYNSLFFNNKLRIFIFDSDVDKINKKHKNCLFKTHGNNVYSLTLPIPVFRKDTPLISIENYFSDDEIKTKDENGRRLYLANEFDIETGRHKVLSGIYSPIGKNKQPNYILGENVFKIEEEVINKSEIIKCKSKTNIALSKNDFANNIYNDIGDFANISMENFSLVFDVIEEIFNDYNKKMDNGLEISKGIYLEEGKGNFKVLSIYMGMPYENAIFVKNSLMFNNTVRVEGKTVVFDIIAISKYNQEFNFNIPITISDELINFMNCKINNNYNRIELHIMDEQSKKYISNREIFATEESQILFEQALLKINQNEEAKEFINVEGGI